MDHLVSKELIEKLYHTEYISKNDVIDILTSLFGLDDFSDRLEILEAFVNMMSPLIDIIEDKDNITKFLNILVGGELYYYTRQPPIEFYRKLKDLYNLSRLPEYSLIPRELNDCEYVVYPSSDQYVLFEFDYKLPGFEKQNISVTYDTTTKQYKSINNLKSISVVKLINDIVNYLDASKECLKFEYLI